MEKNESGSLDMHKKGVALYHTGRYQKALECFEKAGRVGWHYRAATLAKLGRYQEALRCCKKMYEEDHEDRAVQELCAEIRAQADKELL